MRKLLVALFAGHIIFSLIKMETRPVLAHVMLFTSIAAILVNATRDKPKKHVHL